MERNSQSDYKGATPFYKMQRMYFIKIVLCILVRFLSKNQSVSTYNLGLLIQDLIFLQHLLSPKTSIITLANINK